MDERARKRWNEWPHDDWYYHEGRPWRGPPPEPPAAFASRPAGSELTCGCEDFCKGHGQTLYVDGQPVCEER